MEKGMGEVEQERQEQIMYDDYEEFFITMNQVRPVQMHPERHLVLG